MLGKLSNGLKKESSGTSCNLTRAGLSHFGWLFSAKHCNTPFRRKMHRLYSEP